MAVKSPSSKKAADNQHGLSREQVSFIQEADEANFYDMEATADTCRKIFPDLSAQQRREKIQMARNLPSS